MKKTERSQHVTGWTWEHSDLDRYCPQMSPNAAEVDGSLMVTKQCWLKPPLLPYAGFSFLGAPI